MAPQLKTILQLEVPVIVQIGRQKMSLDDVLALQPGTIMELNKHADDELSVLINNKSIGSGLAVKVGENFGLRITQIGSARQRIEALAGGEAESSAVADQANAANEAQPPPDANAPSTPASARTAK